jgi:PrtD family type I secretion system ABC transporter
VLKKLSRTRSIFFHAWLFSFLINLLLLASPLYMLQVFDRVLSSQSKATLLMLTLGALFALLMMAAFEVLRSRLLVQAGVSIDALLAEPVFLEMLRRSVKPGGGQATSELRDVYTLRQFLTGNAVLAVFDAPWAPLFLLIIFVMHWALGVTALIGMLAVTALAVWDERTTRKQLLQANLVSQDSSRFTSLAVRNGEVVNALGMQDAMTMRWRKLSDEVISLQTGASNQAALIVSLSKFLRVFIQVAMLGVGAYLIIEQSLSAGVMMAATIILGRAMAPIELAIGSWRSFVDARGSFDRLTGFFAGMEAADNRIELPAPRGALSLEKVFFSPSTTSAPVLKNVTFSLEAGESVGVVGPSAAGKSTLARVIAGIWSPQSGNVRLDGADVHLWPREQLGRFVGYLPQDVELFSGTVAENIARMRNPGELSREVIEAAETAGAHEMILRLPSGYETEIGEGGAALSGGQRQRIALARALFGNPCLVILDEPNASLDSEGEQALMDAMRKLKERHATVLMVTHKPTLLANADKILVLRNGVVELIGPRNEVLARLISPATQNNTAYSAS